MHFSEPLRNCCSLGCSALWTFVDPSRPMGFEWTCSPGAGASTPPFLSLGTWCPESNLGPDWDRTWLTRNRNRGWWKSCRWRSRLKKHSLGYWRSTASHLVNRRTPQFQSPQFQSPQFQKPTPKSHLHWIQENLVLPRRFLPMHLALASFVVPLVIGLERFRRNPTSSRSRVCQNLQFLRTEMVRCSGVWFRREDCYFAESQHRGRFAPPPQYRPPAQYRPPRRLVPVAIPEPFSSDCCPRKS
jgi:hypothetical protein